MSSGSDTLSAPQALPGYYYTRKRITEEPGKEGAVEALYRRQHAAIVSDRAMVLLLTFFLMYAISTGIKNLSLVYFANYVLGTYDDGITMTIISAIDGIPMVIGIFAVCWLGGCGNEISSLPEWYSTSSEARSAGSSPQT